MLPWQQNANKFEPVVAKMSEEVSVDVIKRTQKVLGKYVKKPPLSDKLLKKPPFRFLQDVIACVIKETGFLKGLYSDEELKSENVKEKDVKIAFLNKLIDAVKTLTKSDLNVRASKIVAGLEPTNTNLLLQAIGKAIENKIDSSDYVNQLNSKSDSTNKNKNEVSKEKSQRKTKAKEPIKPSKAANKIKDKEETPKVKKSKPKESPKSKDDKNKKTVAKESPRIKISNDEVEQAKVSPRKDSDVELRTNEIKEKFVTEENLPDKQIDTIDGNITKDDAVEEKNKQELKEQENDKNKFEETVENNTRPNLVRPKSARPKSGDKLKEKTENPNLKPLEMTVKPTIQRPKSSLRPPSVRPSSARPGAPRLRPDSALPLQEAVPMGNIKVIVENIDAAEDEETVVIENAETDVENDIFLTTDVELKNKGHLVEQILEKIHEAGGDEGNGKQSVEIDWESNSSGHGKEELSQLRTFIQNITKTANPLGKLMNYLHEDIDAMHSELQMWIHTKKQLLAEIQRQQRLSAERDKPLLSQLQQLKLEIAKQQQEINNIQSNILKNDMRIKELISKQLNVS